MKNISVLRACFSIAVLGLCSCATVRNITGKPSFDPASYGTTALIQTVRSPSSNSSDATAAARQLARRAMTEQEGRELMAALRRLKHGKARVAVLETMASLNMTYLREELVEYAQNPPDSASAVAAASTVVALTDSPRDVLRFAADILINGSFPAQRARSARLVATGFPEYAERLFIRALDKETSASAATLMSEFLAQKGTDRSLSILTEIANNVNRRYQADNHLGVKTDADSVRSAAVRGVERIRVEY